MPSVPGRLEQWSDALSRSHDEGSIEGLRGWRDGLQHKSISPLHAFWSCRRCAGLAGSGAGRSLGRVRRSAGARRVGWWSGLVAARAVPVFRAWRRWCQALERHTGTLERGQELGRRRVGNRCRQPDHIQHVPWDELAQVTEHFLGLCWTQEPGKHRRGLAVPSSASRDANASLRCGLCVPAVFTGCPGAQPCRKALDLPGQTLQVHLRVRVEVTLDQVEGRGTQVRQDLADLAPRLGIGGEKPNRGDEAKEPAAPQEKQSGIRQGTHEVWDTAEGSRGCRCVVDGQHSCKADGQNSGCGCN
mmetsp:Transcript_5499/g.23282  ORF Transcript_5499/g.23282 Transcript_5499/m.23282 type:complete len:302 (-) Transcript_5499:1780-2685(-)